MPTLAPRTLLAYQHFALKKFNQSFRILRELQALLLLRAHSLPRHVWFVTGNAYNTNSKTEIAISQQLLAAGPFLLIFSGDLALPLR